MGQVWSKADFDGNLGAGNEGGRGSCLAVTSQSPGPDGAWDTGDDILEPLNANPLSISNDMSTGPNDLENSLDRVRGYFSYHPQGANFVLGDGSVTYLNETIDPQTYRQLSTMAGGEVNNPF